MRYLTNQQSALTYFSHFSPALLQSSFLAPFDVESGYVCWVLGSAYVESALGDGSDQQEFYADYIPGMVTNPIIVSVALYVSQGSPVESTTWGKIKARFR